MALPQAQQGGHPVSSRQKLCVAPRVVRFAGVLAAAYLTLHVAGPHDLGLSSVFTSNRDVHSSKAANTCSLHSCNDRHAKFGTVHSWVLYAGAAAPARDARPGYRALMKNEIVANLAGIPVELAVKDLWQQIFHKGGRQYWIDLVFWIRGYFMYKDARKVAIMITRELQMYLFDEAPVNESAWKATRRLLEQHLREWWVKAPEDPFRSLTAGVWRALVNVYVELLEPVLRGSPKLKELEDLIFDPELKVIRTWTDAAHLNIVRGREDEIISKLDNLARERPRGKVPANNPKPPVVTTSAEDKTGAQSERTAEFVEQSPDKASHSRKTRKTVQRKLSRKSKGA